MEIQKLASVDNAELSHFMLFCRWLAKTCTKIYDTCAQLPVLFCSLHLFVWCHSYCPCHCGLLNDVCARWYWAPLVHTLYMTWRVPRHVFQAGAPSRNSTKYRADDLCGNLVCEYFCWLLSDPHVIIGRSLPFHYTKKQKKSVRGKFLLFLICYSNGVELVHGYSCARLISCLF